MITQHITFYCFKTLLYVAFRERAERTNLFYKINNLYIFWRIFGVMRYLSTGLEVILLLIKGPSFTVVSHGAVQINRQLF